jgi:predicted transposase/invertase (TIGR01784 family)
MCCRTNDGSRIIVEVQRRKQPFFPERAIYYSTFQIQRQVAAGAKEYDFLPVYVVNIMEFDLDRNEGFTDVRTVYRLYEEKSHRLLTDRVTLIFIELNKFKKSIDELNGNILEGMYFCFKNMINLSQRPDVLDHNVFKKIFEVSELYNMDEETRKKVLEQMTTERDLRNQMACATEEGRAIGLAEGLAEGRAEGKEKAKEALKLIAKGASVKDAAEFLGISEAELE